MTETEEQEQLSRLSGLIAMLALPPVRTPDGRERKRKVEIEIAPDDWVPVVECIVEPEELTFFADINAARIGFRFKHDHVPQWRVDHGVIKVICFAAEQS